MKVVDCLPTGKRCPPLRIPISVEALWIARRSESRWSTSRKKIAFWSDGAEPITGNHRHEVVGRPCAGRTLSQCDRSNPCEALWLGMSGRGCDRGRETQPDRGPSASQTEARIPVHIWAVPARDEHGIVVGGQQSFEDRHRHEKAEPCEQGAKDSGYTDEITGIDSRTIMQSHLPETLRSCRCLSAFCT